MASVPDNLLTLSQAFKLYCQREGFVHLRDDEQATRESTIQRKRLASDFRENFLRREMCLVLVHKETGEQARLRPGEWPETPHNAPLGLHAHVITPHISNEWYNYNNFGIYVEENNFFDWLETEPKTRIQSEMCFQRRPSNFIGEVPSAAEQLLAEPVAQTATAMASPVHHPSISKGRRGRKPSYDWSAFKIEVQRKLAEEGVINPAIDPTWTQATLERHMLAWCSSSWGKEPARSTVQKQIMNILKPPVSLPDK